MTNYSIQLSINIEIKINKIKTSQEVENIIYSSSGDRKSLAQRFPDIIELNESNSKIFLV